jgi:hypothetical protein
MVNTASFVGAAYLPFTDVSVVASPITNPSRVLIFVNESGNTVFISWDGTNDHVVLLAGASFIFDEQSNSVSNSDYNTAARTQFYVRGTAGAGNVWLSTFYAA